MATTNKTPSMLDVFERNKYDLKSSSKKSRAWFNQQVLLLSKQSITPNKLMQNASNLKARIIPGNLYMFFYDPKLKETLPYYDRFPLVFPYASTPDGFIGLNMHYLPYPLRIQLLDRLMTFKNNDKMDGTTRIKYSWALISGVSRYKAAEPCIKRYLYSHLRSKLLIIEPTEWDTAIMLPLQQFRGAKPVTVWKDSVVETKQFATGNSGDMG